MPANLDRYRKDLESLNALGERLVADLHARHLNDTKQLDKAKAERAKAADTTFESHYQSWYTEARVVIKQLIPDRLKEFDELYKGDGKQKKVEDGTGFTIQAWLNGARAGTNSRTGEKLFNDSAAVFMRLLTQTQIVSAAKCRLESSLFDIRALVQADLLDSELVAARELAKHGFYRAAGAVAGVVLETHLGQVRENHNVTLGKAHPTVADLNDALRKADVIDVPTWRFVQRLGDIRNLCAHNKNREPTADEVGELLNGVDKIGKTLA
jgi:hypothetical protein